MLSNPAVLLGSILFGAIGLGAFIYGKRMVLYKPMVIGGILMAYDSRPLYQARSRRAKADADKSKKGAIAAVT